jgi:hypothetical protein
MAGGVSDVCARLVEDSESKKNANNHDFCLDIIRDIRMHRLSIL